MNIAVLDEWLPYPADNGKKLRSFHLVAPLAHEHNITYVCPRSRDLQCDQKAAAAMRDFGIEVLWVERPVPKNSGPLFAPRLAANLALSVPYSVQRHTSKPMRRALEALDIRSKIDLWHVEWTPYVVNLPTSANAPIVVDAHNIESMIWRRHWEEEANLAKAWYIRQQWKKFEQFERKAFALADCVVTTTDLDAEIARDGLGAEQVEVVDNGVELSRFKYTVGGRDPANLLFLGSLNWRPNIEAVNLLLERIFPAIRKQIPHACLTIVGLEPPRWLVTKIESHTAVSLHASVPDVRPYLKECGALLVPLRVGGGSRIKILEAMASGCPVISTSIGAEGLNVVPGEHFLLADQEQDFVDTTIAMVENCLPLEQIMSSAYQVVSQQYDWGLLSKKLASVWDAQARRSKALTA